MSQQVQGSLWGRLTARQPAPAQQRAAQTIKPVATMPTHRALTAKDALYTVDAGGRRQYVPLTVDGVPGKWAGRMWYHCGDLDGVLLVAWHERDDLRAEMHPKMLADHAVMLTESAA